MIAASYILEKLTINSMFFVLFIAGVIFGVAMVLLVYKIVTKVKKKPEKTLKKYEKISPDEDLPLCNAKKKIKDVDVNSPIADYVKKSAEIIVEMLAEVAFEYTGGSRTVDISSVDAEGAETVKLTFDADFTLENAMCFVRSVADVMENTALNVTDKYAVALNPILKALNLGDRFRNVTVKNVVFYLQKSVEKESRSLDKKENKLLKEEQKRIEKEKLAEEEKKKNWFLSLFKRKRRKKNASRDWKSAIKNLIKKNRKETPVIPKVEEDKSKFYIRMLNSVISNVMIEVLPALADNARKLYGNGYGEQL